MKGTMVLFKGLIKQRLLRSMGKNKYSYGDVAMIFHHQHWKTMMKDIQNLLLIIADYHPMLFQVRNLLRSQLIGCSLTGMIQSLQQYLTISILLSLLTEILSEPLSNIYQE